MIIQTDADVEIVFKKKGKASLPGTWIRYFDRNHVFTDIINEDLPGISINDSGGENTFTIELGKTISHIDAKRYNYNFDLNFDGKMIHTGGRTNYFILDGDRMIYLIDIQDVLIPVIYQKQK